MTRRTLLRSGLLAIGAAALQSRRLAAQRQDPPAAGDRLYDPSMVQERSAATALDNDPTIKSIEQRLKCTCGCNLDIYTCRTTDFTCTYSPALHQEVLTLHKAGKSPDDVIAAFVAKYGEQVLMAPKPQGFNLAAYLLPGVLVATAGTLLAFVLLRRSRQAVVPAHPVPATTTPAVSAADEERLRRALADVEN